MELLDGKLVSQKIKDEIKDEVAKLPKKPTLCVIIVGDDPASKVYVSNKEKACEYTGINSKTITLPENTSETEILTLIDDLNKDDDINGILVQLPLPKHIDENKVIFAVDKNKDVDCFNPYNVGLLNIGMKNFVPCTPYGIIKLLEHYNIEIEGKNVVIIGRSNIVGKPLQALFTEKNATVTLAHSKTKNLKDVAKSADILAVAIGKPRFINSDYVKDGAVVIDVGIHRDEVTGKLCGDVDFDDVCEKTSYITKVPGGVGPMTISMLMLNLLKSVNKDITC